MQFVQYENNGNLWNVAQLTKTSLHVCISKDIPKEVPSDGTEISAQHHWWQLSFATPYHHLLPRKMLQMPRTQREKLQWSFILDSIQSFKYLINVKHVEWRSLFGWNLNNCILCNYPSICLFCCSMINAEDQCWVKKVISTYNDITHSFTLLLLLFFLI